VQGGACEPELRIDLIVYRDAGHVIGQQVWRALQTTKGDGERRGHGPRQHRLAYARNILDEDMSFTEQCSQDQLNRFPLADDDLLDICAYQLCKGDDLVHGIRSS
jgi:hypothetical protein